MVIINPLTRNLNPIQTQIIHQLIPLYQLKNSKSRTIYPHAHKYYLISFFLEEKENDGDDMAWIS